MVLPLLVTVTCLPRETLISIWEFLVVMWVTPLILHLMLMRLPMWMWEITTPLPLPRQTISQELKANPT